MHFIYGLPVCPPICPPLSTNDLISSSEENLNRRRKPLSDQKFRSYARQIGQQFLSPSSYANEIYFNDKDIDEEFDHISLSDIFYVSSSKNFTFLVESVNKYVIYLSLFSFFLEFS